ncbi:4-hydroxythreonine-4-phosphate dehydrogenase PdxA [Saxibacter everestensis]|uniref:4-hydroxythreonine-4-phosphate dehydrogenase PdxA n=1 Tax=Saxibacter everestensis TaxID=2909229 RepID=A0ABY8QWG0_9MICO|nr:4-hydroxythreonine-4-phosphate dehydrogenase PdxA [Brevibacteriaceae bacterium ZFBP1038]
MTYRPRIALTFGDPAGVGPELGAKLLSQPDLGDLADVLVLASREELDRAADHAQVSLDIADEPGSGRPVLMPPPRSGPLPTELGVVSAAAGAWALDGLRYALRLVEDGEVDAICFTPLNKSSLHLAGMNTEDELRWFADTLHFGGRTSEFNILSDLWTARVTSHIALADVPQRITAENVTATVEMFATALKDSGLDSPRIGVAALNPHAGENGSFGRQEIDEIAPGVAAARANRIDASGPFPSDTIFLRARAGQFDGVVTMYHDQGQIAMKMMGFDQGVTVQGGLPIPIATPAHGTAFDIVGQNKAGLGATLNAFRLAATIATRKAVREGKTNQSV